jgi:hypothetical protein
VLNSLILVQLFATSVNDTCGKFTAGFVDTGVVDTGGAPLLANISANLTNIQNDP